MTLPIGPDFWEQTKHAYLPKSDQEKGNIPQPPLEIPLEENSELLPLPTPHTLELPKADLWETINSRQSVRHYSIDSLSLNELSALLWFTQGIKRITPRPVTMRTVPSGGARHPFETYLVVQRVEGLQPGLYRFAAGEHALVKLNVEKDIVPQILQTFSSQNMAANSAVTFIWAAVIYRTEWRYPQRGYRVMMIDAGHICQNLYLAGGGLGCGVCAMADFDDDLLNQALGLDGKKIFAVYAASLGKKD